MREIIKTGRFFKSVRESNHQTWKSPHLSWPQSPVEVDLNPSVLEAFFWGNQVLCGSQFRQLLPLSPWRVMAESPKARRRGRTHGGHHFQPWLSSPQLLSTSMSPTTSWGPLGWASKDAGENTVLHFVKFFIFQSTSNTPLSLHFTLSLIFLHKQRGSHTSLADATGKRPQWLGVRNHCGAFTLHDSGAGGQTLQAEAAWCCGRPAAQVLL